MPTTANATIRTRRRHRSRRMLATSTLADERSAESRTFGAQRRWRTRAGKRAHPRTQLPADEPPERIVLHPRLTADRGSKVAVQEGASREHEGSRARHLQRPQGHPPEPVAEDVCALAVPSAAAEGAVGGSHRPVMARHELG